LFKSLNIKESKYL